MYSVDLHTRSSLGFRHLDMQTGELNQRLSDDHTLTLSLIHSHP